jgi:predicted secreted hydrolase
MFPSTLALKIDTQIRVSLDFTTDKPFVLHGEQGFSRKLRNSEQASYYYSQPHIQVSDELELPTGTLEVTGNAWFDHNGPLNTSVHLHKAGIGFQFTLTMALS